MGSLAITHIFYPMSANEITIACDYFISTCSNNNSCSLHPALQVLEAFSSLFLLVECRKIYEYFCLKNRSVARIF